jgi:hypothetical protein
MSRAIVSGALLAFVATAAPAADERRGIGDSAASRVERARAAFAQGRYAEALDGARRATEAAPRSLGAQL